MKIEEWFRHPVGIVVSAVAATMLWGSAMPIIKIGYEDLGIGTADYGAQWLFAGYRFTLAGLLLVLFHYLVTKRRRASEPMQKLSKVKLTRLALIQTFLQYLLLYVGLSYSTGIQSSIIVGSTSLFQMLSVRFVNSSERLTLMKITGLLLGFLGIAAVGAGKGDVTISFGFGELLLLGSAFFGGVGNVLAKQESKHEPVLSLTGRQMALGGILLTLVSVPMVGFAPFPINGTLLMYLLYLSVLSAVGFGIWNTVMKYNDVGRVSMYLFLIPVFGVILSSILLGEQLSGWIALSLSLVVSGILIVNRSVSKKTVVQPVGAEMQKM
ncbi:DMT family transporter [Neobacillus mesonae]|nr:DMT family transporter [Neobacillus mesonae]